MLDPTPTPTTPPPTDSHDLLTPYREHIRACVKKVPRFRHYALDDGAIDALAALALAWHQQRIEQGVVEFSRADLIAFFTDDVIPQIPQLVQPSPGEKPPTPNTAWVDEITGERAPNPWQTDPPDLGSQAAITRHDPVLAEHLQRIAKAGVTYAMIAEMKEASAKHQRLAAIRYGEAEHRDNPFRDPTALTAQSTMLTNDPEVAAVFRREAELVRLPWQTNNRNLTQQARLSANAPAFGQLVRQAETLLEQCNRDALVRARQNEEIASRKRAELEQKLVLPPPKP